jgi:hypothetical protein
VLAKTLAIDPIVIQYIIIICSQNGTCIVLGATLFEGVDISMSDCMTLMTVKKKPHETHEQFY